jgi:type IV pilus assembly protein PilB
VISSGLAQLDIASKLLAEGTINAMTLTQSRRESETSGLPMVEILLAHDWISDAAVAQAYAERSGVRFLDLSRRRPTRTWALTLPENLSRRHDCIIFGEVGGDLTVALTDPFDPVVRGILLSRYQRTIQYVVSPRYQIREVIDEMYRDTHDGKSRAGTERLPGAFAPVGDDGDIDIVGQFNGILDEALDRRASDIHLEPEEGRFRVRYRIDGQMVEARAYPLSVALPMISRVKILAKLDITERRRPQDGRFSQSSFDQSVDVRVAIIPTARGERITLRLLSQDRTRLDLEMLGMDPRMHRSVENMIRRPHGIILLTGPTGCGKTTTLYVALQSINSVEQHIITVEDPVEYHIPGVNQVAVDAEYGVSFSHALRSILRHDPDVIMVGEIRDQETAHLALEASLTGHLVFATLHTNSAVGAVTRLLDMGCEPYLVANGLIGVMAQRLVRKVCTNCRQEYQATEAERKIMGVPEEESLRLFRGAGCSRCQRSGYYDRIGVFEFVEFDAGLAELVTTRASVDDLHRYAKAHGAIMLRDDALAKVRAGLTSLEEAVRVTIYTE